MSVFTVIDLFDFTNICVLVLLGPKSCLFVTLFLAKLIIVNHNWGLLRNIVLFLFPVSKVVH